jgi:hypothetical protein
MALSDVIGLEPFPMLRRFAVEDFSFLFLLYFWTRPAGWLSVVEGAGRGLLQQTFSCWIAMPLSFANFSRHMSY